jgi:hypothetical protein
MDSTRDDDVADEQDSSSGAGAEPDADGINDPLTRRDVKAPRAPFGRDAVTSSDDS